MRLFSSCSDCCVCALAGHGCLAGIGDDDFVAASKEEVIDRLNTGKFDWDKKKMIEFLKSEYGFDYLTEIPK